MQNAIATALPVQVDSLDPGSLVDVVCGQFALTEVEVQDLNQDGVPEVLIEVQSCFYGGTGVGVMLFIADSTGAYQPNLGFPGMVVESRPGERDGYPDLAIAGMGFCLGIWGWNGREYEHLRNEPTASGGCEGIPG
jgi:hypothetical protein